MRRILPAIVTMALMAAIPAMAQPLPGNWEGTGDGICPPPWITTTPVMMNPWQHWTGQIPATGTAFQGEWHDDAGFDGKFSGTIEVTSVLYAICTGGWTAINRNVFPPQEYKMGDFTMRFYYADLTCKGQWHSKSAVYSGTMEGEKVD
jgi:hypothetical protein